MAFLKPRIKLSHHILLTDEGDLCIGEIPGSAKVIKAPPPWFMELLNRLDGRHTVPRLTRELSRLSPDVAAPLIDMTIEQLDAFNLLEDAAERSAVLSDTEIERYDRQMLQYSLIDKDRTHKYRYQERLKASRVAILGMGGWGTWVSLILAQLGIGSLRLVDGDHVEISNLNRQVLYDTDAIGLPKVTAAKARLCKVNPHVTYECFPVFVTKDRSQIEDLLPGVSLVVLAWASMGYFRKGTAEEIVHAVCVEKSIPIIELGGDPIAISAGPIYPNDGHSRTYLESKQFIRESYYSPNANIKTLQRAAMKSSFADGSRTVNAWQSSPSLAMMAGLVTDQIVKFLTGYDAPALIGRRFRLDLANLEARLEDV